MPDLGGIDIDMMNLVIDDTFMGRYCRSLAHAAVKNANCVKHKASLKKKADAAAAKKKAKKAKKAKKDDESSDDDHYVMSEYLMNLNN